MTLLYIAAAVFIAFGIEAMTGFGSIVLALSIGALVMDIPQLLPLLVPLNLLITLPITIRQRQHIQTDMLFRQILPWMFAGALIGLMIASQIQASWLKLALALLIVWFATRSLLQANPAPMGQLRRTGTIASAGITHGMLASGGPLLVYALARSGLNKAQFRATLVPVWLALNSSLTVWFLVSGRLEGRLDEILWLIPAVVAGLLTGNWLHHRINQAHFMRMVFSLLLVVGLILLISSGAKLIP